MSASLADFLDQPEDTIGPHNDAQRKAITDFAAQHSFYCVLGKVNIYDKDNPVLWAHMPGDKVYNFGADFAIPAYDEALHNLIVDRDNAPYTGTKDDVARIDAIFTRIDELGGILLIWR